MARIIMVTGGQRSGKSVFAEKLTPSLSDAPTYIATAQVRDEEFRRRVDVHKRRRGPQWSVVEDALHPSRSLEEGCVALLDCLTMLASNHFFACSENVEQAYGQTVAEVDSILKKTSRIVVVTNEIGLGGVSGNEMTRKYTDLLGLVNQHVAAQADEVFFVVSGIPMKIK